MVLPTPPNPNLPVPNNPFYSDPTYIVQGAYYPITVGSGLVVDPVTAVLTSTGGGGGGAITGIFAGPGITVSGNTGNVTITNAGITNVVGGTGISVTVSAGTATITNLNIGTVASITAGAGLSATGGPPGGTITVAGTLQLTNTGVTAGSYNNPTISIDTYGRITSATPGTGLQSLTATLPLTLTPGVTPTIAINNATAVNPGVVCISDSVTDNISTIAASSAAVKFAFDTAAAAIPKSCLSTKGSLLTANSSGLVSNLGVGSDGQVLTADSSSALGVSWQSGGGGGGSGTVTSITAGTGLTGGTITTSGTIALNTACVISPTILSAKGSLISASVANTPTALTVGTDGQVLTACSTCTTGLTWTTPGGGGGGSPATPTVAGIVFGCTLSAGLLTTSLGNKALSTNTGSLNVAIGARALENNTSGGSNVAVGAQAMFCSTTSGGNTGLGLQSLFNLTSGCNNTAVGRGSSQSNTTGSENVAVGWGALTDNNTGCCNVAIGRFAAANITGSQNVAIGPDVSLRGAISACCRLAIGFSATKNWLTGDSTQAIRPEAGIIDCTGSTGTAGQVLMSNGANAICWGSGGGGGGGLAVRTTTSVTTALIASGVPADVSITIPPTYALLKIQTSHAAWVTLYTDVASRTADASRTEFTNPLPGTGVIAEVITSGATTQLISPGTIGFSSDGTTTSYAKIVNKSGAAAAITVTLTYVKLEA